MTNKNQSPHPVPGAPEQYDCQELTNLELLEEIERMTQAGEADMDTDKISAYLADLQERAPVAEDYDPQAAWEALVKDHPELFREEEEAEREVPAKPRPRMKRLICGVAAAAAVICMITVAGSASFRSWVRENYRDRFQWEGSLYRFFNEAPETPQVLPDYDITWFPEEYELTRCSVDEISGVKLYECGDSAAVLMYTWMNEDTGLVVFEEGAYRRESVSIRGLPGDLYILEDKPVTELTWIDEQSQIIFVISAHGDPDTVVKMAESVTENGR